MKIVVLLVVCVVASIECKATFGNVNRGCVVGYLRKKHILGETLKNELAVPNCREIVTELIDSIYENITRQIEDAYPNTKVAECSLNLLQRYDIADVILKESIFEERTLQKVELENVIEKMTENVKSLCNDVGIKNIFANFEHVMKENCFEEDWQNLELRYCFRKHISFIKILDCKVYLNSDRINISNIDCDPMMEEFKVKSRKNYRKKLLLDPSFSGNVGKVNCAMKVNEKAYFYDRHLAISMLKEQNPTEEEIQESRTAYFDMMTNVATNRMTCIKLGFEIL